VLLCRAGGRAAGFGAADQSHDDADGVGDSPGLSLLASSLGAAAVQLGYRPEAAFYLGPVSQQVGSKRACPAWPAWPAWPACLPACLAWPGLACLPAWPGLPGLPGLACLACLPGTDSVASASQRLP
jgi:hypothetical protein